jgi:hypothetical protein
MIIGSIARDFNGGAGSGSRVEENVPNISEMAFNALKVFCDENGFEQFELENYLASRRTRFSVEGVSSEGVLFLKGASVLARLYPGLVMDKILHYDQVRSYFFVHKTGKSGFFPALEIGGVVHYVPCVDVSFDCPLQIVERGGVGNMKSFFSEILVCRKSQRSTTSLKPIHCKDVLEVKFPVCVDYPAMDCAWGIRFAIGNVRTDGFALFPCESFKIDFCYHDVGDWILISQCAGSRQWNYVDCLSSKRIILNAEMLARFGGQSLGCPVFYSAHGKFSVQRDLSGFFSRISLNYGKGIVFPDNFPEDLCSRLRNVFEGCDFDFESVFGHKFTLPVRRITNVCLPQALVSKKGDTFKMIEPSMGVVCVSDLIRGTLFSSDLIDFDFYQILPRKIKDLYSDWSNSIPYSEGWERFLTDYFSDKVEWIGRQFWSKMRNCNLEILTEYECLVLFCCLIGFSITSLTLDNFCQIDDLPYNSMLLDNSLIVLYSGLAFFIRTQDGVVPHDFMKYSNVVYSNVVGYIPPLRMDKVFDLGFHVLWLRDLKLIDVR